MRVIVTVVWMTKIPKRVLYTANDSKIRQKNWENVRDEILKAAIESESIPVGQMCTNCRMDGASYRCLKCGIRNYFCESCIALLHSNKCVFHVVEQWKVSIYNL
jgi:hypothetical protein